MAGIALALLAATGSGLRAATARIHRRHTAGALVELVEAAVLLVLALVA